MDLQYDEANSHGDLSPIHIRHPLELDQEIAFFWIMVKNLIDIGKFIYHVTLIRTPSIRYRGYSRTSKADRFSGLIN